jgi:hypothetical protein
MEVLRSDAVFTRQAELSMPIVHSTASLQSDSQYLIICRGASSDSNVALSKEIHHIQSFDNSLTDGGIKFDFEF